MTKDDEINEEHRSINTKETTPIKKPGSAQPKPKKATAQSVIEKNKYSAYGNDSAKKNILKKPAQTVSTGINKPHEEVKKKPGTYMGKEETKRRTGSIEKKPINSSAEKAKPSSGYGQKRQVPPKTEVGKKMSEKVEPHKSAQAKESHYNESSLSPETDITPPTKDIKKPSAFNNPSTIVISKPENEQLKPVALSPEIESPTPENIEPSPNPPDSSKVNLPSENEHIIPPDESIIPPVHPHSSIHNDDPTALLLEKSEDTIQQKDSTEGTLEQNEEVKQESNIVEKEPLKPIIELPKTDDNPSFGLGYFFGEDSVPAEVEDLLQCANSYADELIASSELKEGEPLENIKPTPADQGNNTLEEIEEIPERDTPKLGEELAKSNNQETTPTLGLKEVTSPEVKSEVILENPPEKEKPKPNLNPLTEINFPKPPPKVPKFKPEGKFGTSYDSATLNGAIGLIDLKSLCKAFAYAIRQHIVFSRGKKCFADLKKDGEARFSYKLGKLLKIELPQGGEGGVKKPELDLGKSKNIVSESLAAITGTHIKPELLNSYLTVEENEDDYDLSYTQTHMGEIFGNNKPISSQDLIKSYRNSLASLKSNELARNTLTRTQNINRMTIQGHSDINKLMTSTQKKPEDRKTSAAPLRRQSSDELDREDNERVDLDSVDITKSYTSPKKLATELEPVKKELAAGPPSQAVSDSLFEVAKDSESNNISEQYLEDFQVYNLNYDFETRSYLDLASIPGQYLEIPSEKDIYKFCKKILVYSKMEKEIPIIALIYIEKLIMKTGLLMNEINWRRFTFIALVIGSKVFLFLYLRKLFRFGMMNLLKMYILLKLSLMFP